uniref:Mitochondrial intermembrane space import and assembly protein 40 homolog n=1 Tax=Oryza glumipatula TaxID=40148 RepID=A0A0D9ZNB7_9ORYZ
MGQGLSQPAQAVEEPSPPAVEAAPSSSPSPAPAPSSLEALAAVSHASILRLDSLNAEAMSFDEDGNESIDVKVQKALDCPCVAELKNGPCGSQFVDAFSCFLKSTEEEKGSDCVKPFIALQDCIKINPEAFSKEILEEEENDEEAEKSNLKVRAPAWSRESKPKL